MKTLHLIIATSLTPLTLSLPATAQDLPSLPIQFNPEQIVNQGREGSVSGSCEAEGGVVREIAYTIPNTQTAISDRTSQAQPTLWIYLPKPINEDTNARFILKNSLSTPIYEGQLSGQTDGAGIISISLPTDLSVGDLYQWTLALNCAEDETITLSGWVERRQLDASLRPTFEAVGDRNRAALYANYGFLQDTLSELAALRLSDAENEALTQDWSILLGNLNLSELSAEPLLNCCQLSSEAETEATEQKPSEDPDPEAIEESETEEPETEEPETEESEEDNRTILQRARDRR